MNCRPSQSALKTLQATFLLFQAILISLTLVIFRDYSYVMWTAIAVFALIYIVIAMIWLPLYFGRTVYAMDDDEILCDCGFFIRSSISMKLSAVQYATLITAPFSAYTGINILVVSALGGRIVLPFMKLTDAESFYNFINKREL